MNEGHIKELELRAHDEKVTVEARLDAAKELLACLPEMEWSTACDIGSSPERIAYIRRCQTQELVNALAHRITDLRHPPVSNFRKHTGLLAWDHPDFAYIMGGLRGDGTNPENEKLLAEKLREACKSDYRDEPEVLEALIAEFVGCRPL